MSFYFVLEGKDFWKGNFKGAKGKSYGAAVMTNTNNKSMIMNVRTLMASGQPVPPYNEVMAFLAEQNKTQMPEELRSEMMDMIARLKQPQRGR